ncbi:hypothetical protein GKE82_04970 [Conexibacter sp. W3-3-2]|uniref:hypothetical protein n=1 Tax=Conexibacter sp. W3-3-2 TaxID=2675227 RepID=UPI0012B8D10F|nr:hypothetical protein [Conexibacter sp. W3-3-2]MTD43673.1 hypothetical protein [Conexibacter sp. W3-3-2]
MFVSINRALRRSRRRLLLAGALLFVAFALVSAHSAFGGGHMEHDGQVTDALAMCLAIGETAAAMFVAAALGRLAIRPGRWSVVLEPTGRSERREARPGARARAGPVLQVFLT